MQNLPKNIVSDYIYQLPNFYDQMIYDSKDIFKSVLYVLYGYSSQCINPLSTNATKWSNTLKQFVCNLSTNCFSVFDHFVGLALKGLSFEVDGMVQNNKKMNISRMVHHFP